MADEIKPSDRSGALGALADALGWARDQGNKFNLVDPQSWIGKNVGSGALGSLILGQAPEAVDRMSYGASPLRMMANTNVPDFARTLSVDAAGNRVPGDNSMESQAGPISDLAFGAQSALPLAKAAGRGAARAVAAGMEGQGALARVLAPVAPMYAVKPKGGNSNTERLNGYLSNLGVDPKDELNVPARHLGEATDAWGNKQLRNYIAKDMGSPSDPLLAVEKEYPDLHLPDGHLQGHLADIEDNQHAALYGQRGRPGRYQERLQELVEHANLTGATLAPNLDHNQLVPSVPLTPWGYKSGKELYGASPAQYRNDLSMLTDNHGDTPNYPAWLNNAPPDTKIWGLLNPHEDTLGFGHVLDYLNAAQEPHQKLSEMGGMASPKDPKGWADKILNGGEGAEDFFTPEELGRWRGLHAAGLAMTPEQVARTSVADAVKKTAQWNEHLAAQQSAVNPDLGRGIAAVHKEYPEDGMRWVKLGTPKDDLSVVPHTDPQYPFAAVNGAGERYGIGETAEAALEHARHPDGGDYPNAELAAGLNAEGKAMGHCVGGYCDQVASDGTQIYSLRDAKNNPHVTVEVRPKSTFDMLSHLGDAEFNKLNDAYEAANGRRTTSGRELQNWVKSSNYPLPDPKDMPPDIVQIKGKQNAAPVAKYLPYVQDFVKSGQWGKIGDFHNAGLNDVSKVTRDRAEQHMLYNPAINEGDTPVMVRHVNAWRDANPGVAYASDKELMDFAKAQGSTPQSGFKKGGSVNSPSAQTSDVPKYSKKAALLARLT